MSKLTEIPQLMLECCDDENFRYDLKRPYIEGDHVWATDGRIMVRLPATDFDQSVLDGLTKDRGKHPKSAPVWEMADQCQAAVSIPANIRRREPCNHCGGKEFTECYKCHGLRTFANYDPIDLGSVILCSELLGMIAEHGATEVLVADHKSPVLFRCGDIQGLLMPMTRDELTKDAPPAAKNGEAKT